MKPRTKVIVTCAVLAGVGFFLFVPAFYWFSYYPPIPFQNAPRTNVYRSLGCETVGFGVTYSANVIRLACNFIIPASALIA